LPKGNVTTRTAYEIMPFENSLIVLALSGNQILEIASYIIKEKKPQPLAGMTFTISKENTAKNILIQGKPIDVSKTYYVVTNDYLANGGTMIALLDGISIGENLTNQEEISPTQTIEYIQSVYAGIDSADIDITSYADAFDEY
jgi:2',3'-cyclic-nucleotide 2'-phosphodiesterase (5'-nucleotidase family)